MISSIRLLNIECSLQTELKKKERRKSLPCRLLVETGKSTFGEWERTLLCKQWMREVRIDFGLFISVFVHLNFHKQQEGWNKNEQYTRMIGWFFFCFQKKGRGFRREFQSVVLFCITSRRRNQREKPTKKIGVLFVFLFRKRCVVWCTGLVVREKERKKWSLEAKNREKKKKSINIMCSGKK